MLLLLPYALLLIQSFWRLRNGTLTHELTTENYRRLFGTSLYPATILYSAGVALRVTVISLLLAFPARVRAGVQSPAATSTLLYMAVIIPLWVSYVVRAYAWKIILGQQGILNGLLMSMGIIRAPLTVLLYSTAAVVLALTHIYTPFTLMPIYAVLDAIPPALKEASQDLYAEPVAHLHPRDPAIVAAGCGRGLHLRIRAEHGRLPRAAAARRQRQRAHGVEPRVEPVRRGVQLAARAPPYRSSCWP